MTPGATADIPSCPLELYDLVERGLYFRVVLAHLEGVSTVFSGSFVIVNDLNCGMTVIEYCASHS